jgi:ectoine hydroxylase
MIDLYPSRYSDQPKILDRKDPVIHTDRSQASHGPLSNQQLDDYEKNGFLFLENFFTEAEVEKMRREIFGLRDAKHQHDVPEIVREPESEDIRSIFSVHMMNDFFNKVSKDQRILDIVSYLLGSSVYVHQSRVNYKPGFKGKEFYWHSDFETWHVEDGMPRMRAVSMSIALSDNYSYNGPLMLIPGSHKHFVSCIGKTPDNHYQQSLKRQEFGVPDHDSMRWLVEQNGISVPTGGAGSILLFECNTMHGSNSNITPLDRNNLFMVFNSVENKLTAPFSDDEPRPEYIASRAEEPILVK